MVGVMVKRPHSYARPNYMPAVYAVVDSLLVNMSLNVFLDVT